MVRPKQVAAKLVSVVQAALDWIGQYELHVLVALLVGAVAIWMFVAIADEVAEGDTQPFDEWAVRVLRRTDDPAKPIGPEWLQEVGRDLTALGGVAALTLITMAVAGFLLLRRMHGAMWFVIGSTLGGLLVTALLKRLFDRPRPDLVPHLSLVYTSSFPSGHSMLSATVYLTLGALLGRFVQERSLRAYFLIVAMIVTGLVGLSRVYLGVHYPTDVLAGWTAGLAWAILCWLVARWLQKRGKVEQNATAGNGDAIKLGY